MNNWKKVAKRATNLQLRFVLVLVYFIFIVPLAFVVRKFSKKIFTKFDTDPTVTSYWRKKPKFQQDLGWAKKQ